MLARLNDGEQGSEKRKKGKTPSQVSQEDFYSSENWVYLVPWGRHRKDPEKVDHLVCASVTKSAKYRKEFLVGSYPPSSTLSPRIPSYTAISIQMSQEQ